MHIYKLVERKEGSFAIQRKTLKRREVRNTNGDNTIWDETTIS
jgi:hypothetical protein